MSAFTLRTPRAFTRDDGRARVAVPFWTGVLSTLGAVALMLGALVAAMLVLLFGVVLVTGRMPSLAPGRPISSAAEIVSYAAAGWFAWSRLRSARRGTLRGWTAHDLRTLLVAIGALLVVRVATVVQLVVTDQTHHVQAGFEHFNVVATSEAVTVTGTIFAVLALVVVGPVVEEIVFRGLLFGALAPRLGVIGAALISALLFGAAHGDLVLFPSLAALGFVAALAYAATGNLYVSIALHALSNAVGAAFLVSGAFHPHH